jgi:hypothetical protein
MFDWLDASYPQVSSGRHNSKENLAQRANKSGMNVLKGVVDSSLMHCRVASNQRGHF